MTGAAPLQLSVLWDGREQCLSNLEYVSVSSGKLVASPDSEITLGEEYWSNGRNGAAILALLLTP